MTEQRKKQENADNLAIALSNLLGAKVVLQSDYDKINKEKQSLLKETEDIDKIKMKLIFTQCKLLAFVKYHSQWKPTTRNFENRLTKLKKEKVYISFSEFPSDISQNLKEAYNCYINGLPMACYIMILRTIEITVNIIYSQHNKQQFDNNGKPVFIPVIRKLNWVKAKKMIGGAEFTVAKGFIEARNDSVHDSYIPSEKQILSAFETVINLVTNLKSNIKTKREILRNKK